MVYTLYSMEKIIAIEHTGGTPKLVVQNGEMITHKLLPLGILRIEPIDIEDPLFLSPPDEKWKNKKKPINVGKKGRF